LHQISIENAENIKENVDCGKKPHRGLKNNVLRVL